jgi:hypothetical protein
MRVILTLDRYDGSQGKQRTLDLEGLSMRDLIFAMMEADVCGVTITKDKPLAKVCEKLNDNR